MGRTYATGLSGNVADAQANVVCIATNLYTPSYGRRLFCAEFH